MGFSMQSDECGQGRPLTGQIYVALGTNKPSEGRSGVELLSAALNALAAEGFGILRASSAWHTPAWPDPEEPTFTNAVVELAGAGPGPQETLARLLQIERGVGRERDRPNAPRTLDLDLIDWRGQVRASRGSGLILPHLRAHHRRFVLLPLQEIAPNWRHPVLGDGIGQLLARLGPGEEYPIGPLKVPPTPAEA